MKPKKVAIVAEWLTSRGGAENVVYELANIFPKADIFTTVINKKIHPELEGRTIRTSFLQKIPFINKKHQLALFLLPKAISSLDLSGYDLIISSSSAFGKGIKKPAGSFHLCYCHTPMRWIWESDRDNRLAKLPFGSTIIKWLKSWDLKTNESVDLFLANSKNTANKIKAFYNKESKLLYPPVDTDKKSSNHKGDFFFFISRLIPYKRADLAIKACEKIGKKLIVAGDGPELFRLKKIAGKNTQFLGRIESKAKEKYFQEASATIFCANEDFGIVPVESLSFGTPVIGYGKGGILEIVKDGENGLLFNEQSVSSLANSIILFNKKKFNPEKIQKSSKKFDKVMFKANLLKIINSI